MIDTLRGEVLEWITQPKSDTGWLVARMVDAGGATHVVTGCGFPAPGSWVELQGAHETHPRFGAQFRARLITGSKPPLSRDGLARWLSDCVAGVGAKTADRLLDMFGAPQALWDVASGGAPALIERGVKPALAESIARALAAQGEDARYQALLNGWGMTQNQIAKVKRHWPLEEATRLLTANPYLLSEHIDGFGFLRADKVARAAGIEHDAPVRVNAAVLYQLDQAAGQGHVFGDRNVFVDMARSARISLGQLATAAGRLQRAQRVVIESNSTQDRVYLPALYLAECTVASELARRFETMPAASEVERLELPAELTEEQRAAVERICDARLPVVFVTGGPGTGKTTILRAALDVLDARGVATSLAAPTGKAARRMAQATGRPASTLHRLLGYRPTLTTDCEHCRAAASSFDYGELPDDGRVVIVDESSMADLEITAALVRKARQSRLVFVGDHNQLPPVGPGQPFQDALSVAPPHCRAELTRVHRSQGRWVNTAAPRVLAGKTPSLDTSPSFLFLETALADGVIPTLDRLLDGLCNTAEVNFAEIEAANGALPVVLSPQRKGAAGVNALNLYLHSRLNGAPDADALAIDLEDGTAIRENSWVMFGKNNPRTGVCNGDTGKVLELVPSPKDATKIARAVVAVDSDTADAASNIVDMNSREAREQLRLAYASTIHKAQGMEYPWVICVVHSSHQRMLTRRLLYTAITRAKLGVIVIGDRSGLLGAVNNAREVARNTTLIERLQQARAALGSGTDE